jgi:glycosyltransferase involved in cell wall biosynthesis
MTVPGNCSGFTNPLLVLGEIALRILMLTQFYHPILGGIERHVRSLSTALAAHGHHVSVATLWHPGLSESEMDGAVRIYRLHGTMQRIGSLFSTDRFHAPPFPDPEVTLSLRRVIAQEQPEIVHAHNWMVHSFLPIKSWSKAKLVRTLHDCEMSCVQMRLMYMDQELCSGPETLKCLRCAAHHYGPLKGSVTLAGNRIMNPFERMGVDKFLPVSSAVAHANGLDTDPLTRDKIEVIPNFVPDDVADVPQESDARLDALPEEPFILQVGDLVPDKGIYVLLEAYQGLPSAPPLVLIGRRMPESPRELPPRVTVIESLPHNLVMQAWQRSLFATVTSLCLDASPTVTLEAMACGRAVIGSRIGGIVDQIIDEETGYLVPPGDPQALCSAMQRLVDDPDLCSQMGTAARAKVVEFQARTVVHKIEKVYQSL